MKHAIELIKFTCMVSGFVFLLILLFVGDYTFLYLIISFLVVSILHIDNRRKSEEEG